MATGELADLKTWLKNPNSFPDRFLSQTCPLLNAAKQAQGTQQQKSLIELLTGDEWSRFLQICDATWRKGANSEPHRPSTVLKARQSLVLAAMGQDAETNLRTAVRLYQQAIGYEVAPQLKDVWGSVSRLEMTAIVRRMNAAGRAALTFFQKLANDVGGWNPALLSTAAAYMEIIRPASAPVSAPTHEVKTHLLFALGEQHGGRIARLTLRRFDIDADAGGGACYPDPVSMACVKSMPCFQQALQQAWWREILPHIATANFDVCWSLQLVGDHGRHNDEGDPDLLDLRTDLMLPLSGPSAGMAFACAFRALRLKETLDPHMAITADFAAHFERTNSRALPVGSVPDKLRAELERAGIDEVLTSSNDEYFTSEGIQPDAEGVRVCQPRRGRLRLIGLPDLDAFYNRASRHSRLTQRVKQHLALRAKELLETTCTPYIRSSLSKRRPGDPTKQEPPEVPVPLSDIQVAFVLLGQLDGTKRLRLLAESGLGKSTLLIEAEHVIASNADNRIPLRLGAGPASSSKDDLGRWTRLPLLSDFDWQQGAPDLLSKLAERLLGDVLPDGSERTEWIQRAVDRAEVVFLLDSLDQTDKALKFDKFAKTDGVRQCPLLLSARPETRRTKSQGYAGINWQTLWVDPFDEERIRRFWDDAPLLDRLLKEKDWAPLREVPVLLQQMKRLANAGLLENLPNREAVYHRTLEMLVQHGQGGMDDAGHHDAAQDDLLTVETLMAEIAWETIRLEALKSNGNEASFTGELGGQAYAAFAKSHKQQLDALDQLNLTTRQTYLDEFGVRHDQFAWRHFSFCEWFAGLHLARLPADEQEACIREHALDERWAWIIRFALSAAQRNYEPDTVNHLARCLLSHGAPFLLWTSIHIDHVDVVEETDTLCRWLVHRDRESWEKSWDSNTSPWSGRSDSDLPVMNETTATILKQMFAVDHPRPWLRRDSRWLHPAWQLVTENVTTHESRLSLRESKIAQRVEGTQTDRKVASVGDVQTICQEIHTSFLNEFEARVRAVAARNQRKFRDQWRPEDQGLLQLVPDDVLLHLGVLPAEFNNSPTLDLIRNWPASECGSYEDRRDQFNSGLQQLGANYCLCPPIDWEHPRRNPDGTTRNPQECRVRGTNMRRQPNGSWIEDESAMHVLPDHLEMQRTPVTNIQFEAFDPNHRRWRQMQWFRPEMESENQALDNHPVVEVSPWQADMMGIWMTGHGNFGTFRLPFEEDWEASCHAGRDGDQDKFGIPWCDEQQQAILDANGAEQFDSLSSFGANFNGNHPYGQATKGPYLKGTVPVGRYSANGFGLLDQHGQAWEWMRNEYSGGHRAPEVIIASGTRRCVRGGSWDNDGRLCRSSVRGSNDIRNYFTGFRLSRTK